MKKHIDTITDLLLGAAYADKRLEGKELDAISRMVARLMGTPAVPDEQKQRIKSFNPAKHNAVAAAQTLASLSDDDKRKVLELVAAVSESDDEIDFDEDAYLRKVAEGLGIPDDQLGDLTIEVLEASELDGLLEDDDEAAEGGDDGEAASGDGGGDDKS